MNAGKIFLLKHVSAKKNINPHQIYSFFRLFFNIFHIWPISFHIFSHITIYHPHYHQQHHVVLIARISLTLPRHSSLSSITTSTSFRLHPVSIYMYIYIYIYILSRWARCVMVFFVWNAYGDPNWNPGRVDMLISSGNLWIQIFSHQLRANSWTDWALKHWSGNTSRCRKNLI